MDFTEPRTGAGVVWANELHVAPATNSTAQARAFVEQYCEQHDLPDLVDDIGLVVSQLVANAVVHAEGRIRVTLDELPFCVELTVYDESVDHPMKRLAADVLTGDEHGRGSWVVEACSTDWGTDVTGDEGKLTWAQFALRPRPSCTSDAPTGLHLVAQHHP